ncbi:MAG: hypothetical protein KAU62_11115 [Candidatus Heimdallarchaeota archaeon]|nr:hypothetical protein [Candidatus Heimdallarchaeota archaeon]MCG3256631.1 hypothetical protein [Candidatus Heimdallarchaeota archaeon]MCK4611696.1 hypothetical protein [Candidatus Heimdallarchaeota archaeon]
MAAQSALNNVFQLAGDFYSIVILLVLGTVFLTLLLLRLLFGKTIKK